MILGAFGLFILSSIDSAFAPGPPAAISDDGLIGLVSYEVTVMAVLGIFLALRGWRPADLGMTATFRDIGIGCLVAAASYGAYVAAWTIARPFLPTQVDMEISPDLSAATVVMLSLVNGIFEEVFVCGYLINSLKKERSLVFAINVSVAVRLAYHLYQGPLSVVSIVPMGLIFGYWFARTGRLWPLVVAHALMDFLALWPYVV